MAVKHADAQLTLLELAKRTDPNGDTAAIVESLTKENEILQDCPWLEANDVWSHKTVRRTTLPAGSWRKLNSGVATEVSKTQEVIEGIGMLESYAEVDKALADSANNPQSFRNTENQAFIEGMGQTLALGMIYGTLNGTAIVTGAPAGPECFDGLAARMPSLAATTNVIGQGGTGSDLTSIFIVQWGPTKVHMIYPRGHKTLGVEHRDLGEHTNTDASSLKWQIYRDWFGMKAGMVVRDDRCIARLANIEDSGTSNTFDEDNLITLLNRMPGSGAGAKLYVNDTVQTQMEIKLKDKANVNFTPGNGLGGEPIVRFRGCAVRKVDAIAITEAALT